MIIGTFLYLPMIYSAGGMILFSIGRRAWQAETRFGYRPAKQQHRIQNQNQTNSIIQYTAYRVPSTSSVHVHCIIDYKRNRCQFEQFQPLSIAITPTTKHPTTEGSIDDHRKREKCALSAGVVASDNSPTYVIAQEPTILPIPHSLDRQPIPGRYDAVLI